MEGSSGKKKSSRVGDVDDEKRKKKTSTLMSMPMRWCQVEKCTAELAEARTYHRRHKVCELHSKSADALVAGLRQRFCQQCSRFHEVWEFDDSKRSCRRRLASHNERRRKTGADHFQVSTLPAGSTSNTRVIYNSPV